MAKNYLVTEPSFLRGAYRYAGETIQLEDNEVKGDETNLKEMNGDVPVMPAVQIAPLSPTGPNPTQPQQIPPDARQTMAGYVIPGEARLVGEVTQTEELRTADLIDEDDTSQGDLVEQLRLAREENARLQAERDAALARGEDLSASAGGDVSSTSSSGNDDDALVSGTVAEVKAKLADASDADLETLRAAEADREQPRKGVLDAIKAEQSKRLND